MKDIHQYHSTFYYNLFVYLWHTQKKAIKITRTMYNFIPRYEQSWSLYTCMKNVYIELNFNSEFTTSKF